jgi:hypothetical protein
LKNLLLICLTLIWGCSQPTKNSTETFIVPSDTLPVYKTTGNQPPPPPPIKSYYFPSNFIIDSGHIYFYQQPIQYGWFCGTGIEWDTPPSFINLKPKDIIEIPSDNLEQFIKSNIQYLDDRNRIFAVASTVDTITSVGLAKIFVIFKDTSNHIKWNFRRTTQEESVVLNYKKTKERYDYEEIKWDSTKILFPLKLDNIKFMQPKVDK